MIQWYTKPENNQMQQLHRKHLTMSFVKIIMWRKCFLCTEKKTVDNILCQNNNACSQPSLAVRFRIQNIELVKHLSGANVSYAKNSFVVVNIRQMFLIHSIFLKIYFVKIIFFLKISFVKIIMLAANPAASCDIKGSCQKKNRFFLGDLSQIWVGGAADSQTFGDIYQPLFLSTKVPKYVWVGQSKPKTKSKFWVKFIKCI